MGKNDYEENEEPMASKIGKKKSKKNLKRNFVKKLKRTLSDLKNKKKLIISLIFKKMISSLFLFCFVNK